MKFRIYKTLLIYIGILILIIVILLNVRIKKIKKHPNGKINQICHRLILSNILDGQLVEYFDDGTLKKEEFYNNGKKQGPQRYYSQNGKVKKVNTYRNGRREGTDSSWYENGNIKKIINYSENKQHGKCMIYDSSGRIREVYHAKNGKRDGIHHAFYTNGNIEYSAIWKEGKFYGRSNRYYSNGQIAFSMPLFGCIPCDSGSNYDSLGNLEFRVYFNLDCDSLKIGKVKNEIKGQSFTYNDQGAIEDKKSFVINLDSLKYYWKNKNTEYLSQKINIE